MPGCLPRPKLPTPEEVRARFDALREKDAERATAYLYELGLASGYIKQEAIAQNICWEAESAYGTLECTINLSKPEKDPLSIAAAAAAPSAAAAAAPSAAAAASLPAPSAPANEERPREAASSHRAPKQNTAPLCDLCWENEEFPGTPEHPAKPGLRLAALTLAGERWGFQYSPYAYYPEHCIALSEQHRPMKIDQACFERLLDFVDLFPFYFIGSNADLPIVGGSILSHDHFQGGRHLFPLMKAPIERAVPLKSTPEVQAGIVRWPASVLRLTSDNRAALVQAAAKVWQAWQNFSSAACNIVPFSAGVACRVRHNSLNPIVGKVGSSYTMDLVLRNNRTDACHPRGIFHAPDECHHIKKENIGLIEIMGLAILPPRLATELPLVEKALAHAAHLSWHAQKTESFLQQSAKTRPHAAWATEIFKQRAAEFLEPQKARCPSHSLHPVIRQEVASVFTTILEATGVFKRNKTGKTGWNQFIGQLDRPID